MIPAEFGYVAPESLEEAIRELHENGEDAKALAGGHSLLPLMKLRLAAPTLLVDLRKLPGLHSVQQENGTTRIGALTTHATLQDAPELGVVAKAASLIADQQVRNCGTIGGSLAHADPSADLPMTLLALGGSVEITGPSGVRVVGADDFFVGPFESAIGRDELAKVWDGEAVLIRPRRTAGAEDAPFSLAWVAELVWMERHAMRDVALASLVLSVLTILLAA